MIYWTCRDGVRKARKVGTKRGPHKRKSKLPAPEAPPYLGLYYTLSSPNLIHITYFLIVFPLNGESSWSGPSDQASGVLPTAAAAIPPQYLSPEGYWPYPYYTPAASKRGAGGNNVVLCRATDTWSGVVHIPQLRSIQVPCSLPNYPVGLSPYHVVTKKQGQPWKGA